MEFNTGLKNLYTSQQEQVETVRHSLKVIANDGDKNRADDKVTKIHGPFLCAPSEKYWKAKVRIVFVGHETNKWSMHADVDEQMKKYSTFNVGENYRYRKSSPFWSFIRKIELAINGEEYCCASLNLNKFDVNGKTPPEAFKSEVQKLDYILKDEIELLQPDVVILLTGWRKDGRLTKIFDTGLIEVEGFKKKVLAEISLKNEVCKIFRTYHPAYLRRARKQKDIINELVSRICHETVEVRNP